MADPSGFERIGYTNQFQLNYDPSVLPEGTYEFSFSCSRFSGKRCWIISTRGYLL